jgi:beta-xylosidase
VSKLNLKKQRAASKGCWAFKAHWVDGNPWCVYVDGEWAPRGYMTKREAINLAYAISISKKVEVKVVVS